MDVRGGTGDGAGHEIGRDDAHSESRQRFAGDGIGDCAGGLRVDDAPDRVAVLVVEGRDSPFGVEVGDDAEGRAGVGEDEVSVDGHGLDGRRECCRHRRDGERECDRDECEHASHWQLLSVVSTALTLTERDKPAAMRG
jgi:hypothetical protein